jgi:hypothetical protein
MTVESVSAARVTPRTGEGSASDEPERREEERSDDEGAII